MAEEDEGECEAEQPKHRRVEGVEEALERVEVLSRANCMHSDAASQGGGWWQGRGAAYIIGMMRRIELLSRLTATGELAKNHIRLSSVNDQTVRTV